MKSLYFKAFHVLSLAMVRRYVANSLGPPILAMLSVNCRNIISCQTGCQSWSNRLYIPRICLTLSNLKRGFYSHAGCNLVSKGSGALHCSYSHTRPCMSMLRAGRKGTSELRVPIAEEMEGVAFATERSNNGRATRYERLLNMNPTVF